MDEEGDGVLCRVCARAILPERRAVRFAQVEPVMSEAGVPPKFIALSRQYRPPNWVLPYVDGGKGLILTGGVGATKSTIMAGIIRTQLERDAENGQYSRKLAPSFTWIDYTDFIMRVQDSFKNERNEESAYKMLKRIASEPRLVIDDLGVEKDTQYVVQATYFLIDHREKWCLPTYITTNLTMAELRNLYGGRVADRISGECDVKILQGKSRRHNRKEEA